MNNRSKLLEDDPETNSECFKQAEFAPKKKERQFNQKIFLPSMFAAFKLSNSGGLVHFLVHDIFSPTKKTTEVQGPQVDEFFCWS